MKRYPPLEPEVIGRLFERLHTLYGARWQGMWRGLEVDDVMRLWARELGAYAERLDAIAYALDNLGEHPPSLPEFKILCRQAPRPQPVATLPAPIPKLSPERIAELRDRSAKLGAMATSELSPEKVVETLTGLGKTRGFLTLAQREVLQAATAVVAARAPEPAPEPEPVIGEDGKPVERPSKVDDLIAIALARGAAMQEGDA